MARYFQKSNSMVGRKIADEFILVPIRKDRADLQHIYTLNGVGARIWELIDGQTTVEQITSTIVREYEVETPEAQVDVIEFLEQMKGIGSIIEKQEGK